MAQSSFRNAGYRASGLRIAGTINVPPKRNELWGIRGRLVNLRGGSMYSDRVARRLEMKSMVASVYESFKCNRVDYFRGQTTFPDEH